MAMADLKEVLSQFAAEPGLFLRFLREKLLTQWLEPTCGSLWYGNLNGQHGPLAALAAKIYTQGGALRAVLEGYMNVFQQALYLLACAGGASLLRREKRSGFLVLLLSVLGGLLYHLIFEAKSQYSYMYMVMLLALAAQGALVIEGWLMRLIARGGDRE